MIKVLALLTGLLLTPAILASDSQFPSVRLEFEGDISVSTSLLKEVEKECRSPVVRESGDFVLFVQAKQFDTGTTLLSYTLLQPVGKSVLASLLKEESHFSPDTYRGLKSALMLFVANRLSATASPVNIANQICRDYEQMFEKFFEDE